MEDILIFIHLPSEKNGFIDFNLHFLMTNEDEKLHLSLFVIHIFWLSVFKYFSIGWMLTY